MDQSHDDDEASKPAEVADSSHLCQVGVSFNQPQQVERRLREHFPELLVQAD
jgi:hypothetical protein